MKEGIHPKYHASKSRCACGATWKTRSTKPELHLEICSNCHPFFTGRQKLIDTEGRVERFTKKFGAQTSESRKKAAKAAKGKQGGGRPLISSRSVHCRPSPARSRPRVPPRRVFVRSARGGDARSSFDRCRADSRNASVLQRKRPRRLQIAARCS